MYKRSILALAIAVAVVAGAATPASAAPASAAPVAAAPVAALPQAALPGVLVPMGYFGNGNYYYTTVSGGVIRGNVRFSWSHMWYIENNMASNTALNTAICGALPTSAAVKSACVAFVLASAAVIRDKVRAALSHKKCLTVRWALPPAFYLNGAAIWEVTCTR